VGARNPYEEIQLTKSGIAARIRAMLAYSVMLAVVMALPARLASQDHDHAKLHFSHPILTESPSPDSKFRVDFIHAVDNALGARVNTFQVEGEFGFSDALSLAVVAPFVSVTSPADARANALGNVELQLKAASFRWDENGVLVGGGITAGLPTGSDAKGIGSGHIFELEPFVDAAYKQGRFEGVAFLSVASTFNQRAGEERERYATLNASSLFRAHPQVELLAEVSTSRDLYGTSPKFETVIAPGIKWLPAAAPKLAIGISRAFGIGELRDTRAFQLSGFYHF
jgi:hypothetical protein